MREIHVVLLSPKAICDLLRKSADYADICACRNLHHYVLYHGYLSDAYLPNYLIRVYARCNCLPDAHKVFTHLGEPTVFSWSAIISAYAQHALHEQAFQLYAEVRKSRVQPDGYVYTAVLNACMCEAHLIHGQMVHGHILDSPYKLDIYINNTLIDMYARCGCLHAAHKVFNGLPYPDIVTWNTLLAGYAYYQAWEDILLLFKQLEQSKLQPNQITFVCVFKACASLSDLSHSILCHFLLVEHGLEHVGYITNVLIDVYGKCGSLHDAEQLFAMSSKQDVVTWTSIISGYVDHGDEERAFDAFVAMQARGFEPNEYTYASICKACSNVRAADLGRLIHTDLSKKNLSQSIVINNALIGMYAQCGSFYDACRAFEQSWERDVVTWNSIITACIEQGYAQFGLQLFKQLQQEGFQPDILTLASTVRACSIILNLYEGKILHVHAIASNLPLSMCISNNLLHMYVSCSSFEEARSVFDSMQTRDVVTWNVMIGGYANCGLGDEAVSLFDQMQIAAVHANQVTIVCMLKACAITSALDKGRLLHACILRNGFGLDAYIGSALVNFYVNCGRFWDAQNVFLRLKEKSVVPWSVMIAAYAKQNNYREALVCFEKMQQQGLKPDDVVFVSLLSACSHAGILNGDGFPVQLMAEDYGLEPILKHYNCLADLLGRAGHLSQAMMVLQNMPFHLDVSSRISLLSHCRTYAELGHAKDGMVAGQQVILS